MTTIPEILRENAALWPDRDAIIATRGGRDERLTFSALESAAERFAGILAGRGLSAGDAVLVFVPMSMELYVALLGIFRLGGIAVFIDPSSGLRHINACCRQLPPRALIAVRPLRWLRPFVSGLRSIPVVLPPPRACPSGQAVAPTGCPAPEAPALITFTSGSTGQPKAAVRTHRFLIAQHLALKRSISLEPDEMDLTTLPVFVLANLASGVTSILPDARISHPGSVDAQRLGRQIRRLKPTRTGGSPAFYRRLAQEPGALSGFKKIYTGGAPVFPAVLQNLQKQAPSCRIVAVYGSTEAEPIAEVCCDEIPAADWSAMREGRGLLAGIPVPEIRLRVIADQWGQQISVHSALPAGEPGEIIVTGDHVLKGYLHGRGDEETKVSIAGEIWHRTGDAGYLDDSGRLWLLGRCAAKVRSAAGILYPFAVECIAMSFPSVLRAAFVGVAERRVLAVELDSAGLPGTLDALKSVLCNVHVDEVRLLRHIPVDSRHNAKINYPKLARMLR